MPRHVYSFDDPDRFIAGTVGEPGHRTFYLQAREGTSLVSVVIEKVQVAALAERLTELLDEVRRRGADVPETPAAEARDSAPLDQPIVEAFRVGAMTITWDGDEESILLEARAMTEDEEGEAVVDFDDDEDGPDVVRVRLEPAEALAFAHRAVELVDAGRPPCPFCGQPLNPEGHICARRNGYMH
jgi:uncharacterized repeat protein (TIGR03847 family)